MDEDQEADYRLRCAAILSTYRKLNSPGWLAQARQECKNLKIGIINEIREAERKRKAREAI